MQELALALNAGVFGEEGEALTDVATPAREIQGRGSAIGAALLVAILAALYWL